MHILDILILVLLAGFAISGLKRGLVFELLVILGLGTSLFLTLMYQERLQDLAGRIAEPGWEMRWITGLVFLLFFLIVYLGFAFIGHKLHTLIDKTPFKWPDRILGIFAGAIKGAFLIGVLVTVLQWADNGGHMHNFLSKSQLIRWGRKVAHNITYWEPWGKGEWVIQRGWGMGDGIGEKENCDC
ncbi:CvpA family protein [bacterium]|jgi:uncharacterized membrane protein required for colicin V production|nr:CvpA family protein [bacterium]